LKAARRSETGFTLIELMIIVAIIALLAAVAIPRFAALLEKTREGVTKGNVSALRGAARIYYSDNENVWPSTLAVEKMFAFSQYLDSLTIPAVKCTNIGNPAADPSGNSVVHLKSDQMVDWHGSGWAYDSSTGNVFVNSTGRDSRGESYTTY
jgi:type IV pilus assembly protein PilA